MVNDVSYVVHFVHYENSDFGHINKDPHLLKVVEDAKQRIPSGGFTADQLNNLSYREPGSRSKKKRAAELNKLNQRNNKPKP